MFADCNGDVYCSMACFGRVNSGSSNLFMYGGRVWVFYDGAYSCNSTTNCQKKAIKIQRTRSTYLYGTDVKSVEQMTISDNGASIAARADNGGGRGGVNEVYLFDTSSVSVLQYVKCVDEFLCPDVFMHVCRARGQSADSRVFI